MRIVSLLPSATEILFAIGAGPEVVAVTHECDFPAEAQTLPRVTRNVYEHSTSSSAEIDRHIAHAVHSGSSIYALDEELLNSLQPDLIVTQELCEVCAVSYRQVANAVRAIDGDVRVISLEPASIAEILETIRVVGDVTGHLRDAERVIQDLEARIEAVVALSPPDRLPSVACIEWTDPLMPGGHWVPEMVRLAGGRDALWDERVPSTYIDWSRVVDAAPDAMVLMPCGYGLEKTVELAPEVTSRDGFETLPCFRDGRVFAVDGSSYYNRPGPRIVDGLELLAAIVRDGLEDADARARRLSSAREAPSSMSGVSPPP